MRLKAKREKVADIPVAGGKGHHSSSIEGIALLIRDDTAR